MVPAMFDVGGVRLPQPFRIRRLGHFGVNVNDTDVSLDFYSRLLGLLVSDPIDFGGRLPPEARDGIGPTQGYFMRHGTEHHSFVLFPKRVMDVINPHYRTCPFNTTNQITWQVGSLREVINGFEWFKAEGKRVLRAGRDIPGSNWHFYPPDPDGHVNELFYGIEQVGWSGHAKPAKLHAMRYDKPPALPHRSESAEVSQALESGVGVETGWRHQESAPETFDVDGVLLARPFKIVGIGPVRIFVEDMDQALRFYQQDLGLTLTEEVVYNGHRCAFLRANTEHHSIALYPVALRLELGLKPTTTLMSFGFKLANYTQLKNAVAFLEQAGVAIKYLPPGLFPGMDYCAFALDPDGHALQLYCYMEQIGWDGKPRPASMRPIPQAPWPDVVDAPGDAYRGETYLGPFN